MQLYSRIVVRPVFGFRPTGLNSSEARCKQNPITLRLTKLAADRASLGAFVVLVQFVIQVSRFFLRQLRPKANVHIDFDQKRTFPIFFDQKRTQPYG